MQPTPENKAVAQHVLNAFGGFLRVYGYQHDTEDYTIDILHCHDRPCEGVTAYSTIGLSDYTMATHDGRDFSVRLELAGACASADDLFPNILASVAFCIMRTKHLCHPGSVMRDYVSEYYPLSPVPHLYFTAPFLWEDSLRTLDCGSKKVSWLMAIPISDGECDYLAEHGDESLEDLFEKEQIDVFDLRRESVV